MSDLNSIAALTPGRPVNQELVRMLRGMVEKAQSGEIVSCAVVHSRWPGDTQATVCGGMAMELYVGADVLKQMLMAQMMGQAPNIIRKTS